MTPTEALDALVAVIVSEPVDGEDERAWRERLAVALAQAQAVLAQCQSCRHAPDDPACIYCSCCQKEPATDPIERLKEALKPAPTDPTTWPTREAIVQRLTWPHSKLPVIIDSYLAGEVADAIRSLFEPSKNECQIAQRSFARLLKQRADEIDAQPTPEALAERIVGAIHEGEWLLTKRHGAEYVYMDARDFEALILRAIQETPR